MALVPLIPTKLKFWKKNSPQQGVGGYHPPHDEERMLAAEKKLIWGAEKNEPRALRGIAVSGGGVRSATVALGAFQVLAENNLLCNFTYISSVSGGGYIASALSWFWSSRRLKEENATRLPKDKLPIETSTFGFGDSDFPFQERKEPKKEVVDPRLRTDIEKEYVDGSLKEKAARNLEFLRNHGSYLTSGDEIGLAALFLAVLRTVSVSLLVWLPLLISLFVFVALLDEAILQAVPTVCDIEEAAWWCDYFPWFKPQPLYSAVLFFAFGAFVLFLFSAVTLSLVKPGVKDPTAAKVRERIPSASRYLIAGLLIAVVPLWYLLELNTTGPVTGAFVFVLLLISGRFFALGAAKLSVANASYLLRRGFDRWSNFLPITVAALSIGLMPYLIKSPPAAAPTFLGLENSAYVGLISLLSGVWTALYGYYVKARSIMPGLAGRALAILGSLLFLYGLLLFSFISGQQIANLREDAVIGIILFSLFVNAVILGFFSSVNTNGLHRFYRDRLMETFMPMATAVGKGTSHQSDVADTLSIEEIWNGPRDEEGQPYHIINSHAILTKDEDPKIALRGGDNFIMSAGFVGSKATGWMTTKDYLAGNGPLTLASAMAASGAAANANAGYIGTGITRERFLSLVMSLLNIRLGLWVTNPRAIHRLSAPAWRSFAATYFGPVLRSGIAGYGNRSDSKYIDLSDGGHFENLGIYELVRRRVRFILAIDAEQDGPINLSSLVSSANRIKEDFGATIDFVEKKGPEILIGRESEEYPGGVKISKSPFVVGRIQYPKGPPTALIYIKATMMPGLEFTTKGYRASNPDFPHQSTADQFFDPEQFEAYRDLGRKSCAYVIEALKLTKILDVDLLLENYGFTVAVGKAAPNKATGTIVGDDVH